MPWVKRSVRRKQNKKQEKWKVRRTTAAKAARSKIKKDALAAMIKIASKTRFKKRWKKLGGQEGELERAKRKAKRIG